MKFKTETKLVYNTYNRRYNYRPCLVQDNTPIPLPLVRTNSQMRREQRACKYFLLLIWSSFLSFTLKALDLIFDYVWQHNWIAQQIENLESNMKHSSPQQVMQCFQKEVEESPKNKKAN